MIGYGPHLVVLTGYLGSGKTTLLTELLATEAAAETAVIVNEAGEIGLDGAILREAGGDVAMTMLANGCICCRTGSDLARAVEAILQAERPAGAPPLARIVLETSGLSKPGPILRQLAELAAHRMPAIVAATYDAVHAARMADAPETGAQWAGAHRIVATRLDAVPASRTAEVVAWAAAANPLAEVIATHDRREAARLAFRPSQATATFSAPVEHSASRVDRHGRVATAVLRLAGPVAYDDLAAWLDNLAGALGERLLRLKGLVDVPECPLPLLVESVGTAFSAPRPFRGPRPGDGPFLVIIGRDLDDAEIRAVPPLLPARAGPVVARPALRPPAALSPSAGRPRADVPEPSRRAGLAPP